MEASSKKQIHLIIVPYNGQGHMIPALQLAHKLATLGFQVTYVCHHYRLERIEKHFKSRSCSDKIQLKTLKLSSPANGEHESSTGHDSMKLMTWSFRRHHQNEAEFRELMLGCRPDCIISNSLLSCWTRPVARDLGVPWLVFFPSNALALSFEFHMKDLLKRGKIPLKLDEEFLRIPGLTKPLPLDEVSGPVLETIPECYRDFYSEISVGIHDAAGVMCNTFTKLEEEACFALKSNLELNPNRVPFLEIGPVLPEWFFEDEPEMNSPEEDCLNWLDQQPPHSVVYISFGSFWKPSRELVVEIAFGLEASGERFLWVLYEGLEFLPDGFLQRTSSRGMVLRNWAPQLLVLSHKSVGVFLSHCGWNSTMESISRGVPVLPMPFCGEQKGNAKIIVEQLGVEVELKKDETGLIRREVFEGAFREVIGNGERLRIRAKELKEEAHAAMKNSSARILEFVSKVIEVYRK